MPGWSNLGSVRRMPAVELPMGRDALSVRRRVETLEKLLERAFVDPGDQRSLSASMRVAGLIPVAGDLVAGALGLYLVWEAQNLGMPKWQLARMVGHVGFDALLGAVPLAGDLADFLYRSNSRNLKIVRKHLDKHHPGNEDDRWLGRQWPGGLSPPRCCWRLPAAARARTHRGRAESLPARPARSTRRPR